VARTSVLSFGYRAPWLPTHIIDFDGNKYRVTPSLRWEDQYQRLRNLIGISRDLRAMRGKRTPRRNVIDGQNRRLRSRIAINRNLQAMYGPSRPRRIDEQTGRVRNWIAINQLCRMMYRPKQRMRFASNTLDNVVDLRAVAR
jgi:hypothetical protein